MTLSFREIMQNVTSTDTKKVQDMTLEDRKAHGRYFRTYNQRYSDVNFETLMRRVNKAMARWRAEPKPEPVSKVTFGWRQPHYATGEFNNRFHEFYLWDFIYTKTWHGDISAALKGYDNVYTGRIRTKKITKAFLRHILREEGYDLFT